MILYNHQLRDRELNIETRKSHHRDKDGKYKIEKFCESIFTFDIEVTSAFIDLQGNVIPYEKGKDAEYWNSLTPLALCYIWQFSCDGVVYYGRELKDFRMVLDDLPKDCNIICWVHNLAYEFMFLTNIITWDKVFAKSPHKPMKASCKEYPNIQWRCSYMLTRLSLDTWGKQLGVHKLTGNLDYEKLRTPLTELEQGEMDYCEVDCLVVEAGIKEYIKKYKRQSEIPLTQTGTVRQVVKEILMCDDEYRRYIKRLVPHNSKEYKMLQEIFAGGYTHASRYYSGRAVYGLIMHFDFASSYPTVMVCEKYPSTPWVYIGHELPDEATFDERAYIFVLRFKDLKCTTFNTYIQGSKSRGKNIKYDNGRVLSADELELKCTEQDYLTIKETYRWSEMEVVSVYQSYKDYLPKPLIEYILSLYKNKTSLKPMEDEMGNEIILDESEHDLYMQSKQYINSIFGMSVTAIVQANVILDGDVWSTEPLTEEYVDKKLKSLRDGGKSDKRYFLNYSAGCWVTAYARRNLWKCIIPNDDRVIYADTDSIFIKGEGDFEWYNNEITDKLRKACEDLEIDFELTRPRTRSGKQKPLGIFTKEPDCTEFITLGAKRYVERRANDGKLHLTVSGINKEAVELLNDEIENFKDGFDFDKDADCVKKRLSTYIVEMPEVTYPDGYRSTYTHGINLRRTGYNLSMTTEYKALIEYGDMLINELDDQAITRLLSTF